VIVVWLHGGRQRGVFFTGARCLKPECPDCREFYSGAARGQRQKKRFAAAAKSKRQKPPLHFGFMGSRPSDLTERLYNRLKDAFLIGQNVRVIEGVLSRPSGIPSPLVSGFRGRFRSVSPRDPAVHRRRGHEESRDCQPVVMGYLLECLTNRHSPARIFEGLFCILIFTSSDIRLANSGCQIHTNAGGSSVWHP